MRNLNLLLLSLIVLSSCSRKKEDWALYSDPQYPISIKYLANKMTVDAYQHEPDRLVPERSYWISVEINVGDEFPEDEDKDAMLYDVIIPTLETFKGFPKDIDEIGYEEANLNGTPAIVSKDQKGRIRTYILLIPNVYAYVWLGGVDTREWNPEIISQKRSDRVEDLTYQMIKHFKWNQEIDTNSEEFRKWKEHVWEILKSGTKK